MWKSHYEDLFNCLKKDKNVNDFCKTVDYEVGMEVSHSDIIQAIQDLKDSNQFGFKAKHSTDMTTHVYALKVPSHGATFDATCCTTC